MSRTAIARPATGVGDRVRTLRRAAGLTQDALASGRFTKQYVSQIERGEIVPNDELLEWLAGRLGVEPLLLATGFGEADLERVQQSLEQGERLLFEHAYADAVEHFDALRASLPPEAPFWAAVGAVHGETQAFIRLGRLDDAHATVNAGRALVEDDGDAGLLAEIEFLDALCAYSGSDVSVAIAGFGRALELLDRADEPNDRLRCDIHQWRSRGYRRLRDWDSAREDIDRALELCTSLGDLRRSADANLQASLVAERLGRWVLARRYAETCRDLCREAGDTVSVGRVLNNLAGLNHSLGNDDVAVANLREAFQIFVEADMEVEAGYVLSSLAEIERARGELAEAEIAAARALTLLDGRVDHIQEIGTAQLVLARTYLERGELEQAEDVLLSVDESYELTESISHRARSWMTRGELELARANEAEAARLYRQAAVALQPAEL